MMRAYLALAALACAHAVELPSCGPDTDAHCVGEGADLSNEGIAACLQNLGGARSESCSTYLRMVEGCAAEIGAGGACESAHAEGETAACLLQRVPRDQHSGACVATLPEEEVVTGLKKMWADGKRWLEDDEVEELDEDDRDTYKRWVKKKKGKKSEKQKERDYAVRTQKKEMVTKQIKEAALAAAKEGLDAGNSLSAATEAARTTAAAAVAEDKTDTLKPFTKGAIKKFAEDAVKAAKAARAKGEL